MIRVYTVLILLMMNADLLPSVVVISFPFLDVLLLPLEIEKTKTGKIQSFSKNQCLLSQESFVNLHRD